MAGSYFEPFRVKGKTPLCQKAYALITGISLRSLQRYSRMVKMDSACGQKGRRLGHVNTKTEAARAWFQHYVSVCSDRMPNASIKGQTEVLYLGRRTDMDHRYRSMPALQ